MNTQHELTSGNLLDEKGDLMEAGFSYSLIKKYDRNAIKAKKSRIKEWDYYYIGNNNYGIAFTIADNSYMSLLSISFLDFQKPFQVTKTEMGWFSNGKIGLPSTSEFGNVKYQIKGLYLSFENNGKHRHLVGYYKNFMNGEDFYCDVQLFQPIQDTMVIATPFNKKAHFYYNQKINCLEAKGVFKIGDKEYSLNDASGVLDWGRGVWTYCNTWYWSSLSGISENKTIGFNLGYGFGDTTSASENMFFYDGKAYKLNDVTFNIPQNESGKDDFMKPWTVTSGDGIICLDFKPIIDRYSGTNAIIIKSIQHQVFGTFNGYIMINDEKIMITDLVGFAEKVKNCW